MKDRASMAEGFTSLFFMVLSSAYLLMARDYPPGARLIPTVVAIGTLLVAAVQLVGRHLPALRALVTSAVGSEPSRAPDILTEPLHLRRSGVIIAWTLFLYLLICTLGLVVAVPAFVGLFLGLADGRSRLLTVSLPLALGLLTYLLIVGLLELPWNEGFFWSLWG